MKVLWDTDKIVKLLAAPDLELKVEEPGGDYDTCGITVRVKGVRGEFLTVCGFVTDKPLKNQRMAKIEMIEIASSNVTVKNFKVLVAYGTVVINLRSAGLRVPVVHDMKEYF